MTVTVEIFFLCFAAVLVTVCLFSKDGLFVLVYSEACWILLYCLLAATSFLFDATGLAAAVLPALILGAVDCGIWVIIIACCTTSGTLSGNLLRDPTAAFYIRAGRSVLFSKYIK